MTSRTLTFGVELEFLATLPMAPSTSENYLATVDSYTVHRLFSEELRAQIPGLRRVDENDPMGTGRPEAYDSWYVAPDKTVYSGSLTPAEVVEKIYPSRVLSPGNDSYDASFVRTEQGPVLIGDVELTSPILRRESESWEGELANVLTILHESRFGLYTNETCGLHVHVGLQGSDQDEYLEQAQKMAAVTTIWEPLLDQLHPADRRDDNEFCMSNRKTPQLAQLEDEQVFDLLAQAGDLAAVANLVNHGEKERKVNFMGPVTDGGIDTIEFRQHEGAVELAAITHWVLLVTGLVGAALDHSMEDLRRILVESEKTMETLFEFIGDVRVTEYYTGEFFARK